MKSLLLKVNRFYVVCHVALRLKSSSNKHNLESLLIDMPKTVKHTAALKKQRLKLKEKSQKYIPGIVTLKVLGSGAIGAPRSLYVFTDQSRYMFNCGEGTQRLAHEHKMKLAKLEHIFFTHGSWENIGGLPGLSLTIQDVGVPEITVHGPQGIVDIFSATRRFIVLKDLSVKMADFNKNLYFEDNVMRVNYVPLRVEGEHVRSRRTSISLDRTANSSVDKPIIIDEEPSSSDFSATTSDDETDYYAHERGHQTPSTELSKPKKKRRRRKKRSVSVSAAEEEEDCAKRRRVELVGSTAMSYICKLHPRPGALNLEACVERGVPPGPLLGRLKAGEDVTLPDGSFVKSSDVTLPDDPGPVFIVTECPDERFLDPLLKEVSFARHQCQASNSEDVAFLVVHFTPPHILENPRYRSWMDKFPSGTQHLIINETNDCMGSVAVHRIQYKLNLLNSKIFPLLSDVGIPVNNSQACDDSDESQSVASESTISTNYSTINKNSLVDVHDNSNSTDGKLLSSRPSIYYGKTFSVVQLRPQKLIDRSSELSLNVNEYKNEVFEVDGMLKALEELRKSQLLHCNDQTKEDYPLVTFLGTGSCIPNKTRNTSGILLNIDENSYMLMDCGEGTYGQLVRFYGRNNICNILTNMSAIFISHLHADHHIGLIGVLKARHKYASNSTLPLFLIAPKQIMTWLKYYDEHFESILHHVELVSNSDLVYNNKIVSDIVMKRVCNRLNLSCLSTAIVKHCPNAFGVAIQHKSGWKITYSGDTMPSDSLVELGKDSDLLIHEATMEDDLKHEAQIKMHSTTSEAIEIGKKMNAQFTLLTHFSQRYATLPRFNNNIGDGIGIAFDNMKVSMSDLPRLPILYPALQLMFSAHQDELEQKAYRRQMKQLRVANNSRSRSPSPTSSQKL